jgi:hypothetical protein
MPCRRLIAPALAEFQPDGEIVDRRGSSDDKLDTAP